MGQKFPAELLVSQAPGFSKRFKGFLTSLAEGLKKQTAILVILEDRFPPVTPVHHMINSTWVLNPELACHGSRPSVRDFRAAVNHWKYFVLTPRFSRRAAIP